MSDAADPDPDAGPSLETELDYWGNATERTRGPVVFVDAICVICENYRVANVPEGARDWTEGHTFGDHCRVCSSNQPHNVVAFLTRYNRDHERGYLNPEGGYAPDAYEYIHLDDHDEFSEQDGLQQCPGCGTVFSPNSGHFGPVYDTEGEQYEVFTDADPGTRLYCPDCWPEHLAARRAIENEGLDDYGGGVDGQ